MADEPESLYAAARAAVRMRRIKMLGRTSIPWCDPIANVQTTWKGSYMANPPLRTRPLDTFLADWTWDRFLAVWKDQVGLLPDLCQHIVPLYAPRFSFSTWCWWPRGEEEARLHALQHYVLTHPNGDPLLWFPKMRSGERDTAAYLSAAADSDAVAATLICATLHPYVGYARRVNLLD
jgi:hypothetical protein